MDSNELSQLLGLKPKAVSTAKVVEPEVALLDQEGREVEDTVLRVDEWDYEQGQRLAPNDDYVAMTDFFAAAFHQDPTPWEDKVCVDERRQEFLETLMETPDYKALHASTAANLLASDLAATQFTQQFRALQKADDRNRRGSGTGEVPPQQASAALYWAVGRALENAQQEVEDMEEMEEALGCGKGAGNENGRTDPKRVAENFKRVRNSSQLRRIIELAGRYRRAAQAKQRQKCVHGYDDMIGVVLDGDVGRLLPLERVMLADEEFELDAMRRLVERQSMCREYRGIERIAKGPIVVCVDESGSMSGERIANAKAFALAMAWIARHQNRVCILTSFSDAYARLQPVVLRPGKWNEKDLMDWLEHFSGGGTDTFVPLTHLPRDQWPNLGLPKGKTDMILLTDGIVDVPLERERIFKEFKQQEQVKLITIVIAERTAGQLANVSDQVHFSRSIDVNSEAVDACFAI